MPDVFIADLTAKNKQACLALSPADDQRDFLPDIASSLAMAAQYPDARPLAICTAEDRVVGFALYGIDDETGYWKIYRLLIDRAHQRRGYGGGAIRQIIDTLRTRHGATTILIAYHQDNEPAKHLYHSIGFEEYGQNGTIVRARLD